MTRREQLGIAICTFNNRDLVIKCLHSIKRSLFTDYHIYLVDNASSDGTYEAVEKEFPHEESLTIIRNEENLGCSGGFDTGIRAAYDNGHKYIACLDSDILLNDDAISILYDYLENHDDVAVAGSRVMYMDQPDVIQWVGSSVRYGEPFANVFEEDSSDKRSMHPQDILYFGAVFEHQGEKYEGGLEKVIECDLLPACAYMFKSKVLDDIGFWDVSYFLYWDETDWQKRVKDAGWKLVCCTDSVIWHKNGSFQPTNTRALYYGTRNVVKYFGKYVNRDKLEELMKYILWSNFQLIYGSNYRKLDGVTRTVMMAIEDAVHGIGGACLDGRVFDRNVEATDYLMNGLKESKTVLIKPHRRYDADMAKSVLFNMVIKVLRKKDVKIFICYDLEEKYKSAFEGRAEFVDSDSGEYDLRLKMCAHVNVDLPQWEDGWIIVDPFANYLDTYEGWIYFKNYEYAWRLFYTSNKDVLLKNLTDYHDRVNLGEGK